MKARFSLHVNRHGGRIGLLLLAALLFPACAEPPRNAMEKERIPAQGSKPDVPSKIDPAVWERVQALYRAGVTRSNAPQRQASRYSTPLVKVDSRAFIHSYVHLESVSPRTIQALAAHGAEIERTDRELGIVLAWLPFDRIRTIAQLPGVERIAPPSYGRPRQSFLPGREIPHEYA